MEVKVTLEDFDLEAIVDKALTDEIARLTGVKLKEIADKNGVSWLGIKQMVDHAVNLEVNRAVNKSIEKIDAKIMVALEKEIDGLAKAKVAKALSAYERLGK